MSDFVNGNEDLTVILNDEDGNEIRFLFLDLIEYDGKEYVVLLPEDEEDGEVFILEPEYISEEEKSYASVEDEDILMAVFRIFKERNKDKFNFVD